MSDTILYYPVCIRLNQVSRYFLWYSREDDDRLLLNGSNRLQTFDSFSELTSYAALKGFELTSEKISIYDRDRLMEWLVCPVGDKPDCPFLLNAWNLLIDITESVGMALPESDETIRIRDLLFWGCNLPSVTPPGERFDASFNDDEVATIVSVLLSGLDTFRNAI